MLRCIMSVILACFCTANLCAQNGANQIIKVRDFELNKDEANFFTNEKGLEMNMLLHFSEVIDPALDQTYRITWRLEDAAGNILFESSKAKSVHDRNESVDAAIPFGEEEAPNGIEEDIDFFIPYKEIDAKEGTVNCQLIVSASHKVKSLPDFYSKKISFEFKKVKIHPFEEQTFEVKQLKFGNHTGIGFQKMEIDAEIHLAYGPGEVAEETYGLYWQLLDNKGKELYNSSQDFFTKSENIRLSSCDENDKGGWVDAMSTGVQYKYLDISGKQELTFVLFVKHDGKLIKIHEAKKTVDLPLLKKFSDQEFIISHLKAKNTTKDGAKGLLVTYDCQFKYNKIDGREGDLDYYFYLKINRDANEIYNPEGEKPTSNLSEYLWMPYMTIANGAENETYAKSIFIPYYLLKSELGLQDIELSLHATNATGAVKFKTLGTTEISIDKPALVKAEFELTELSLVEKDYDPAVGNNYEKRKPDTQWFIKVGDHFLYEGDINTNDYGGLEDKTTLVFSEGDEVMLYIIDHDKLFNPNDLLAKIELDYEKKKIEVKDYQKGDVKSLSYSLNVE